MSTLVNVRGHELHATEGAAALLERDVPRIVITGARAATAYGERVAAGLVDELRGEDVVLLTGGAYGVEGAAMRAAVAAGVPMVTVVPGGLDRIYPAGLREVIGSGPRVSEQADGVTPSRLRFLSRGALLAELATHVVVVEAGARSGALHVARSAPASVKVGAVPCPITSAVGAGGNQLLEDDADVVTFENFHKWVIA